MKKQLLRLTLIVAVLFSVSAAYAQPILWTENGFYKIGARGTNLFMTINGSTGALEWATELPGEDPKQVWKITDHRTPASGGLMEIWATIPGQGNFTLAVDDVTNYPVVTLIARPGDPVSTGTGDWSGKDQFQRRKAKVNANGDPDSNGANPADGNNALFFQKSETETNSRYGIIPSAAGDPVQFDGGGIDVIDFHFVAALSTPDFDTSSIFISSPVINEIAIKGLTSKVKQVSVYTILGSKVLTKKVDGQSALKINVNGLSSGMYIVELSGDSGKFTKKIIKQ